MASSKSQSTASTKIESNVNLERDDTLPMWEKLSDKPEGEIRPKKLPLRWRLLNRLFTSFHRSAFNNRAYPKSVREKRREKRREKKPLVGMHQQTYVAPNCENDGKGTKSHDSKDELGQSLESSSSSSTRLSSTYHRIVMGMSIHDIIGSTAIALTT